MGRRIYRMCLFVVLVIAVAGGVYYFMTVYQEKGEPNKGTFVNRMTSTEDRMCKTVEKAARKTGEAVKNASGEIGEKTKEAARQVSTSAKEVSRQVSEGAKEVSGQAGEAAAEAFQYISAAAKNAARRAQSAASDKFSAYSESERI